jgi:hypothetical protein
MARKNPAAVQLGRKGGKASTPAQDEARRINGRKGGRPRKDGSRPAVLAAEISDGWFVYDLNKRTGEVDRMTTIRLSKLDVVRLKMAAEAAEGGPAAEILERLATIATAGGKAP